MGSLATLSFIILNVVNWKQISFILIVNEIKDFVWYKKLRNYE
jgi:hypothetical protein